VFEWHKRYAEGREDVEDEQSGHLKIAKFARRNPFAVN
jgi:hypothetical protein